MRCIFYVVKYLQSWGTVDKIGMNIDASLTRQEILDVQTNAAIFEIFRQPLSPEH